MQFLQMAFRKKKKTKLCRIMRYVESILQWTFNLKIIHYSLLRWQTIRYIMIEITSFRNNTGIVNYFKWKWNLWDGTALNRSTIKWFSNWFHAFTILLLLLLFLLCIIRQVLGLWHVYKKENGMGTFWGIYVYKLSVIE